MLFFFARSEMSSRPGARRPAVSGRRPRCSHGVGPCCSAALGSIFHAATVPRGFQCSFPPLPPLSRSQLSNANDAVTPVIAGMDTVCFQSLPSSALLHPKSISVAPFGSVQRLLHQVTVQGSAQRGDADPFQPPSRAPQKDAAGDPSACRAAALLCMEDCGVSLLD